MKTATMTMLVLLVMALTPDYLINAQSSNYKNINSNSIAALNEGINSDNPGVRRSSIYMAGYYKIDEATDALKKQIKREKNPNTRILIALSLYYIGNPEGMEAVKNISENDSDMKVKRMSTAIYRIYIENCQTVSQR